MNKLKIKQNQINMHSKIKNEKRREEKKRKKKQLL